MNDHQPLGSLAQASRSKELKTARWILIIVGILTILINAFQFASARSLLESEVEKEYGRDAIIDEEKFEEAVRMVHVVCGVSVLLGVAFIICGVLIYRAPAPSAITGLVLYIGANVGFWALAPELILQGIIIKVIIIICLVKAVQAAIAYQKEASRLTPAAPEPGDASPPGGSPPPASPQV